MHLLYLDGRRSEALRHFDRLRTVIGRTEAARPEDETVRLRDEIARAAHLTPSSNPNTHVGLAAYYDTRGRTRRRVLLTARIDCSSDEAYTTLVASISNAAEVVLDDFELSLCAFFRDVKEAVDVALEAAASASSLDGTVRAAILGVEHANQCVPSERLMERAAALVLAASPGNVLLDESAVDLVLQEHAHERVISIDLGPIQLADLQLPRRVRLLSVDPEPAMPRSLDDVPNNLPRQSTAFVGRRRDVSIIREQLVLPDTRVLTLTGVGGVGKTRLALHVAAAAFEHFSDGIYFVDLVPTKNVDGVIATIASRLQLPHGQSRGDGVLRKLCDRIGQKKLLLLLDNLEHIRGAARCILSLLAHCVNLTLLVTTREPLHIQPEHIVAVPPLNLPGPPDYPRAARTSEAVELFLDRARTAGASFSLDEDNLTAIGEVCRRLDGLPLAIELVAARSAAVTPPALLALVARDLSVARSESPDLPERQRSLESEIAWSYGLLEPAEQTVFRRSAVFPDTWTLQSLCAVCSPDGASVDVSSIVFSLTAKNMVSAIPEGSTARFRLLNTLRAFAIKRLRESGEEQSLLRRLDDYESNSGAATEGA
jgi:predicted ATPase